MKKLFLTLATAAAVVAPALAEVATFEVSDLGTAKIENLTDWTPKNQTQFSFAFAKNNGQTAPLYLVDSKTSKPLDIRVYAKGSVTLTAAGGVTVQKVVYTLSAQGLKRLAPITANVGTIAAQAAGDATVTWTGAANEIVFTVGDKANYGSDSAEKAGQLDFNKVEITYSIDSSKKVASLSFSEETVEVIMGAAFTAPELTAVTDGAITYASDNDEVASVTADGTVTINGKGTAVITATSAETDTYFAASASYTINVVPDPANIIYSNECTTDECGFTVYNNGDIDPWSINNQYGLKASAYINKQVKASDAIMGSPVLDLSGRKNITLTFEHALNQFKENNENIECTQENINKYVSIVIAEVSDAAVEPVWNHLSDALNITKWSWDFVEQTIDLSAYSGKQVRIGFHYVSTDAVAGTWEIKNVSVEGEKNGSSSVELNTAEEAAPVYYNLQGVRVAQPERGIYIKVVNGKSTKIVK